MKSKPNSILTTANYFETGVDETSGIILRNPDGQMAVMALTMRAKQPKRGVVACEDGLLRFIIIQEEIRQLLFILMMVIQRQLRQERQPMHWIMK